VGAAPPVRGLKPSAEETARRYAGQCLQALGFGDAAGAIELAPEHPAAAAARCGLMALTGDADGEPELCPAPLAACADGVLAALAAIAPAGALRGLSGSQLLTERAALMGLSRKGAVSANGSCRLLQAADGVLAVNLARADDWELLPAWLQLEVESDWNAVAAAVAERRVEPLIEQGRELGLAVADVCPSPACGRGWPEGPGEGLLVEGTTLSPRFAGPSPASGRGATSPPLVVDLSSLWAGPLCSHLLQLCGADVIKLESLHRPDGARSGSPAFFDLLHAGKRSITLDFKSAEGRAELLALLQRADIVIEASRPRALRQLGIDAEACVAARPQQTWISITGHGRAEPQAQWIAYGDDAGVAAGLSSLLHSATGRWLICGDAIADPLSGLHAALAAWAGWRRGGGGLVDLSMVDVVRRCAGFESQGTPQQRWRDWMRELRASGQPVLAARARAC
jgi:crotonobetainyl-CoA:carnitine CoA-transferase CaiB-like acyl-CoA transferase